MNTNGIILIDSSDDDIPCKIRKIDKTELSLDSQEEIDDVVIIDEATLNENKCSASKDEPQKEREVKFVKRAELTTLKDKHKIHVSTEFTKAVNGDSVENNNIDRKELSLDSHEEIDDVVIIGEATLKENKCSASIDEPQKEREVKFVKRAELTTLKDKHNIHVSTEFTKVVNGDSIENNKIESKEIDDVVIIDKATLKENKCSASIDEPQKEREVKFVKRAELTTLKDEHKIHVSTEFTKVENGDSVENNSIESKDSNCDTSNLESIIVNKKPSTSSIEMSQNVSCPEFEAFLEACSACNCDTKYKNMIVKKLPAIKCKYTYADETFVQSKRFIEYLINRTEKVKQKPLNAIIIFNEVYRELESKKKKEINYTDREKRNLRELNTMLKKVHKKIKYLENKEVDFEEDCNSSYIMLERYKERLCDIQKKICNLTNENFYSGRYLFRSLDSSCSKYSEINRAIDKLYNKEKKFPSYYEVDKCIRKCAKKHNLNFSEDALRNEVRLVFTAVGNILQRRRKLELYDSLTYFLEESEGDPAENNPEFEAILQGRQVENEKKIDDLLQKFTDCQERNEEPEMSSDSDDSHHASEDSES